MTELQTTHHVTVTEDMIDHLGHMNVRYYGVAARAGSDAMVRRFGGDGGPAATAVDLYTRHFREQMLGADLEVRSALLGHGEGSLRLYHELRNVETDDLAGSFVHRLEGSEGGELAAGWPPAVDLAAVDIPEHGRPRSIELETAPLDAAPSLDEIRDDPLLTLRLPRAIGADECRPDGSYDPSLGPFLLWGGEPAEGAAGPALHPGPGGQLIGWATVENRMAIHRLPGLGTRIQSFGAVIEIGAKTMHRILWGYDVEDGEPLIAFEVVDVALDTVSRRAVTIPDDLRAHAEARLRRSLAPRVVSPGEQLG